jgi:hypothetical protein
LIEPLARQGKIMLLPLMEFVMVFRSLEIIAYW